MELVGKKIAFLGDSITQGCGTQIENGVYPNGYVGVFERLSGATCYNHGLSGTRIARKIKPTVPPHYHDLDFNLRAKDMPENMDIVVVFGGTNDFGHGDAPLGDFNSRDIYTFYGAVHLLCEYLLNKYPNAYILFMTPLHRHNETVTINYWGDTCPVLCEFVKAIKEVTSYYSIDVLDLWADNLINPNEEGVKETYMPDGLHPNEKGAEILAHHLYNHLKNK